MISRGKFVLEGTESVMLHCGLKGKYCQKFLKNYFVAIVPQVHEKKIYSLALGDMGCQKTYVLQKQLLCGQGLPVMSQGESFTMGKGWFKTQEMTRYHFGNGLY